MMASLRALVVALCFAVPAYAQVSSPVEPQPAPAPKVGEVIHVFAGVNGIWFDGPSAYPADFELGGNARASLSPHISLVGAGYYGVQNSYFRGSAGGRITVSDVSNPDFSIGVGIQYQASTKPSIRPQEWAPDVSVGWKPFPQYKRLSVGAQASYGLTSKKAYLIAAARYALNLF